MRYARKAATVPKIAQRMRPRRRRPRRRPPPRHSPRLPAPPGPRLQIQLPKGGRDLFGRMRIPTAPYPPLKNFQQKRRRRRLRPRRPRPPPSPSSSSSSSSSRLKLQLQLPKAGKPLHFGFHGAPGPAAGVFAVQESATDFDDVSTASLASTAAVTLSIAELVTTQLTIPARTGPVGASGKHGVANPSPEPD